MLTVIIIVSFVIEFKCMSLAVNMEVWLCQDTDKNVTQAQAPGLFI